MTYGTEARCGHSYTRGGTTFVCVIKPHPSKPDNHHFQTTASSELAQQVRRSRLVVIPGERD